MLESVAQNAAQVFSPELNDGSQDHWRHNLGDSMAPRINESSLLVQAENFELRLQQSKADQSDFLADFIVSSPASEIQNNFKIDAIARSDHGETPDLLTGAIATVEFTNTGDILLNHSSSVATELRTRAGRVREG